MRLIGQPLLVRALRRHRQARQWIETWVVTVQDAAWTNLADVRKDDASADGVKLPSRIVVTIFDVKGNEYRLLTKIDYDGQVVQFLELLTHAEYDKNRWKERY